MVPDDNEANRRPDVILYLFIKLVREGPAAIRKSVEELPMHLARQVVFL